MDRSQAHKSNGHQVPRANSTPIQVQAKEGVAKRSRYNIADTQRGELHFVF